MFVSRQSVCRSDLQDGFPPAALLNLGNEIEGIVERQLDVLLALNGFFFFVFSFLDLVLNVLLS